MGGVSFVISQPTTVPGRQDKQEMGVKGGGANCLTLSSSTSSSEGYPMRTLEYFKGTKAMTRGHRGNRPQCLREVSGLVILVQVLVNYCTISTLLGCTRAVD